MAFEICFAAVKPNAVVRSVPGNILCEIQKSRKCMIVCRNPRAFYDLYPQKIPRRTLPVNSNNCTSKNTQYSHFLTMKRLKRKG